MALGISKMDKQSQIALIANNKNASNCLLKEPFFDNDIVSFKYCKLGIKLLVCGIRVVGGWGERENK